MKFHFVKKGTKKLTVSCIIPVKNRKNMVIDAIESALSQKLPPDEIIVVDDGSTDGTHLAIEQKFGSVEEIYIIRTQGGLGPGVARNLGARISSGKVLMFLDSDDTWLFEHTELLLQGLCYNGKNNCAFGISENLDIHSGEHFFIPGEEFSMERSMLDNLVRWCPLVPSAFAISRQSFFMLGGFDNIDFGEDWCFFLKAAMFEDFFFVPKVVTMRRLHGKNICTKSFSAENALILVQRLHKMLSANPKTCSKERLSALDRMMDITKRVGKRCRNVQEWYITLKDRGMF